MNWPRVGTLLVILLSALAMRSAWADPPPDRYADSQLPVTYFEQNWSATDSLNFYSLRQGSPLILKEIFDALEQPTSQAAFGDPAYLAQFGFLPQKKHEKNPDGYPIGFVPGVEAIEINCSACHTSKITWGEKEYRVDGTQAMTDFEGFLNQLVESLRLTLEDAPDSAVWETLSPSAMMTLDQNTRFGRFAQSVLKQSNPKASRVYSLLEALRSDYARRQRYNDYNDFGKVPATAEERSTWPKHPQYGFGRIDALGAILNQATAEALDYPKNARTADAPVNYPAIWDAPQHTHVQWNGSVENEGFGALGRNVGQVVGVFGLVNARDKALGGYDSSINRKALETAEELITKLWSPRWPEEFGLNEELVAQGSDVYESSCISCHALMTRDDPNRKPNDRLISISDSIQGDPALETDVMTARNWSIRRAKIGVLAGRYRSFPLGDRFGDDPTDSVYARDILSHMVINVLARTFVPWRDELTLETADQEFLLSPASADDLLRYKCRPLNGVWSTSPYLHNGSVINMTELLKLPADRATTFHVGTTEYDPDNLGFKDAGSFEFDTNIDGNRNTGHAYGTDLSDDDKQALLEYLKTL